MVSPPPDTSGDQSGELAVIFILFTVFPAIAVGLRIYARRLSNLPLWWDDWLLVAAMAVVIVHCVFEFEARHYGMGKHVVNVPSQDLTPFNIWAFAGQIYYPIVVTMVKCSVLFLYIRLFGIKKWFTKLCYGTIALVVAWGISTLFPTIFQCVPVAATWDHTITHASCINLRSWLLGSNIPNIIMDVFIILLPTPLIWQLKLSWPRRIGLMAIFLVALTTTVVSILRVIATANINTKDVTWSYGPISIYSTVEGGVGVMCACFPIFAPLLRICVGRRPISEAASKRKATGGSGSIWSRPSVRDENFSQLPDDETHLYPSAHVTSEGQESGGGQEFAREENGRVKLGRINVKKDVYVETSVGGW